MHTYSWNLRKKEVCHCSYLQEIISVLQDTIWGGISPKHLTADYGESTTRIPNVMVYNNDIMVANAADKEHLETLGKVFAKLQVSGLKLKQSKCSFMLISVEYLEHCIFKEVYVQHEHYQKHQHQQMSS